MPHVEGPALPLSQIDLCRMFLFTPSMAIARGDSAYNAVIPQLSALDNRNKSHLHQGSHFSLIFYRL